MPAKRYIVTLTSSERKSLQEIIAKGTNASKIKRAYMLLGADASPEGKQMTDLEIQNAYHVSARTVERLRERFVVEGFATALHGKPSEAPRPIKMDGDVEAHLIALACGEAPDGHSRWSLRLLADQMVELCYIDRMSHESVRQVLKKTNYARISG